MNTPASLRSRNSWIRSGRCWTIPAGALAGLCLIVLLVWEANDASFRVTVLKWEDALGLQKLQSSGPSLADSLGVNHRLQSIRWDGLGERVNALHLLVWTGVAATAMVAVLTLRRPTAKRILVLVSLIVAWGLLCGTQTVVDDWRARRQVAPLFPRIERAGLVLSQQWPTQTGRISPDLDVFVDPKKLPDVLLLRGGIESYPFREEIGRPIERDRHGILRFDLAGLNGTMVEYHPEGTLPAEHRSGFGFPSPPVVSFSRLKEHWYLVRYAGE